MRLRNSQRSVFSTLLGDRNSDPAGRRWIFVPYDQLSDQIGPLASEDPSELGIVVIENGWKAALRPYHKQKLAVVLANLRHFALEQAERGVAVLYVAGNAPYADVLRPIAKKLGTLRVMRPAERELRVDLLPLCKDGLVAEIPHEGWLTTAQQFAASQSNPPWRMDAFYRHVRRQTGVLMEQGKPTGGKFSFDSENRLSWKGSPAAPLPLNFTPDEITLEVGASIEGRFARHPGELHMEELPATKKDAHDLWVWARENCLPLFGPYEDAMSLVSESLFHSRISVLQNLHRLLPATVVRDAEAMDIPLPSKEGFIRQILGWREFMHHVHEATDGFRSVRGGETRIATSRGDAGFKIWSGAAWRERHESDVDHDGGAQPSALGAKNPLPPTYWGAASGLNCLDHVVKDLWKNGYGHHITRLMILSNIATLLDISPRELTDWFWVAYVDAYDWVVEPNVLGMGTFGLGDLFTTKPYISGAAYINRMSDYCSSCAFDPKKDCPITPMYWAFLERHKKNLEANPRLAMPYRALQKRTASQKKKDAEVFEATGKALRRGESLTPL